MKGGTVQILWHGKDPILSVDFHLPTGLLATAGADKEIKFWSLHRPEKSRIPSATFKASFSRHLSAVNVLRFSPSGELLASGADNGELVIWENTQADGDIPSWKYWRTLNYHLKDVLDLAWSPDGAYLVSGSVDNTCVIWNVQRGTAEQVLADHQHYVQGVAWDPAGKYVASLSGDRSCRIYSLRSPTKRSKAKDKNARSLYACQNVLCKNEVSAGSVGATTTDVDETPPKQARSSKQYLFHDENIQSFFRRLSWSPDGSFLLIPSGVEKVPSEAHLCSVSYIVSRHDLSRPALQLPAGSKPVVATRFCPVLYKKSCKPDTNEQGVGAFQLSHKLVFAVATLNSVFIYDTEHSCPIAIFAGLHYAPITDLAWSFDAKFLAVSSQDGYCTLVGFDEGDLGTPVPRDPKQASTPVSEAVDKETSELWELQKCSTSICRSAESQQTMEVSGRDQASVPTKSGRGANTTPLREDRALAQGVNPCTFEKPQDPNAHVYVRPLKFKRISPKVVSDDIDKPVALKPNSSDTSVPFPRALQQPQPP